MDLSNLNSFFGEGVVLKGSLKFKGLLRFDGTFEGNIESDDTFIVGSSGNIKANVKTGYLYNFGKIEGDVEAVNKISLHASSKLTGNIKSPILITEEQAFFQGSCSMPTPPIVENPPQAIDKAVIPVKEPDAPLVSADGGISWQEKSYGGMGKVAAIAIGLVLIVAGIVWSTLFQETEPTPRPETLSLSSDSANLDPIEQLRQDGREAFEGSDWEVAVSKFSALVEEKQDDEEALLKLAVSAVNAKLNDKAIGAYEKLASINPGLDTLEPLANLYEKEGNKVKLISTLKKMTKVAPGDKKLSNKLNKLTEIKVTRGDVAGKLKNEIRNNRRDLKPRIKLANHYINKADYVRALAVLKKGTADFPNKENIRRLYANTLHRTGKEKEALEQYILLATSNPDIVEAVNNLAFSQLNKGLLTEATANFNTTLSREPNNFRGRLGLAMVYSKLEENNKAETECKKILNQVKDYAPAMNRLAWIYAKQGINLNKAEALSKKSLAIFDNIPEYIDTLSEINYKKGNHDEAIRLIKRAVKLIPSDSYYKRQLFKFRRAKGQS